ncbi:gp436 family protein [Niveispirillum sp. KHB5.9]|uniref:gp436 family protein n=1 Tax=Niveispirillum sp. KHB5.9 TaxID=3400269 RepID=UPI003A8C2921
MGYATLSDLERRFGLPELLRFCDRDRDGVPDAETVAQLLADADSEINSYLAGRYALPLAEPFDPLLTAIACNLVRLAYQGGGSETQSPAETAAKLARQQLKDLADGRAVLAGTGTAGQPAQGGEAQFVAPEPVFTPHAMAGWLP